MKHIRLINKYKKNLLRELIEDKMGVCLCYCLEYLEGKEISAIKQRWEPNEVKTSMNQAIFWFVSERSGGSMPVWNEMK